MNAVFARRLVVGILLASVCCNPVIAQETSAYDYDNLGRLKKVSRTYPGGTSAVSYSHDDADNRTSLTYSKSETSCRVTPNDYSFNIGGSTGTIDNGKAVWIGLTGFCSGSITIAYASQNDTAVAGTDYAAVSSQVTIDASSATSGYYSVGWARRADTDKQYYVNFTIVSGDAILNKPRTTIGIYRD